MNLINAPSAGWSNGLQLSAYFRTSTIRFGFAIFSLFSVLAVSQVAAGTRIIAQSNFGEFTIELYDEEMPTAVSHFLANLEAGNYRFSMIHAASATVVAGGLYFYESCSEGPLPNVPITPLPIEPPTRTNDTRTIALVPNSSDPSTLSGQWVINLGNNDSAFEPALKPVVFGEVVDGFNAVDSIADLWRVPMDISPSVPTVNYDGFPFVECGVFNRDNVVRVNMQVEASETPDPGGESSENVFDPATGMLSISVDAGTAGFLRLSLLLQTSAPLPILQVQPETVMVLSESSQDVAKFDALTGELTIPTLRINGEVAYRNLLFSLTDAENLFFTLLSADLP